MIESCSEPRRRRHSGTKRSKRNIPITQSNPTHLETARVSGEVFIRRQSDQGGTRFGPSSDGTSRRDTAVSGTPPAFNKIAQARRTRRSLGLRVAKVPYANGVTSMHGPHRNSISSAPDPQQARPPSSAAPDKTSAPRGRPAQASAAGLRPSADPARTPDTRSAPSLRTSISR